MHHLGLQLLGALAGAGYLLWYAALAAPTALFAPSLLQRAAALGASLLIVAPWAVVLTRLGLALPKTGSTLARLRWARRTLAIAGGMVAFLPYAFAEIAAAGEPPEPVVFPVWVGLLPLVAYLPGAALYLWDALYVGRLLDASPVRQPAAAIVPK